MKEYRTLSIKNTDELLAGTSLFPVSAGNNLIIGNGRVYPEINFTLPQMTITKKTLGEVKKHYLQMIGDVVSRAKKLNSQGFVVEFEHLPPLTEQAEWGTEITAMIKSALDRFYNETGIPNALRVTVVDLRDGDRPPLLRKGDMSQKTLEAFRKAAQAGADILSIESVGGKEVHDMCLMYGDINGIIASLGILACRDMGWLWDEITAIANIYGCIAGGDTACGFSNTAMQLAGQGMLPEILAALDRAAAAPRSLTAYEHGAIGPSKDCAYEGPIIKAITGYPISMEGKSSCCAHFSPLGNIAAAVADLWSNESVQNVRLLSGNAPEAFMELLEYDCRLFNTAIESGTAVHMRDMLVQSDLPHSVQALMLEPETVMAIAGAVVAQEGGYARTRAAVYKAMDAIEKALENKTIHLEDAELNWMDRIKNELLSLPLTEDEALDYLNTTYGDLFLCEAYGL